MCKIWLLHAQIIHNRTLSMINNVITTYIIILYVSARTHVFNYCAFICMNLWRKLRELTFCLRRFWEMIFLALRCIPQCRQWEPENLELQSVPIKTPPYPIIRQIMEAFGIFLLPKWWNEKQQYFIFSSGNRTHNLSHARAPAPRLTINKSSHLAS